MRWFALMLVAACSTDPPMTKERLGAQLFEDPSLSNPKGQACADCHMARTAFRDPESDHTSSMGVLPGSFGSRNAPTAMYASYVPTLHQDNDGTWTGGLFWDGRANTLENQATGPLLNPLEMNNPDKSTVVNSVRHAGYARAFRELYGANALDDVDTAFDHITDALSAFERTSTFAPFSSKYDQYVAGTAVLDASEHRGLAVFEKHCASCHPPPMFTTFGYANIGIPRYENNPYLRRDPQFVDHGLMATTNDPAQDGKFRIPTLRNIVRTAPYGHNGYFENLPFMLDFLSSRDLGSPSIATCSRASNAASATCAWPSPEVPTTVDQSVGHLHLSATDLADLYAFLLTLTDA